MGRSRSEVKQEKKTPIGKEEKSRSNNSNCIAVAESK
jgi:hypothetical protein